MGHVVVDLRINPSGARILVLRIEYEDMACEHNSLAKLCYVSMLINNTLPIDNWHTWHFETWARSHLHLAWPCPSDTSFTAQSSCPHNIGILSRWEPMSQYPVQITNIQVDIIFIIPKSIDEVPSRAKGTSQLKWPGIVTLVPKDEKFPRRCR